MIEDFLVPITFKGWSCFKWTAGPLTLTILPSLGGRIISLSYHNQELLFTDSMHHGETIDVASHDVIALKKQLGFRLWGGDKTWVAPQANWISETPPIDLDAGAYQLMTDKGEVVLTSPVCRETGLQITRRIKLQEGVIHLSETLLNASMTLRACGVWNVTQIPRPCTIEIPVNSATIRSYHHEDKTLPEAPALEVHDYQVTIKCTDNRLFKYGGMPSEGTIIIVTPHHNGQCIRWTKVFELTPQAYYAHHSAVEVFNSSGHDYAEAEIHSPLQVLKPNESLTLTQQWSFHLG